MVQNLNQVCLRKISKKETLTSVLKYLCTYLKQAYSEHSISTLIYIQIYDIGKAFNATVASYGLDFRTANQFWPLQFEWHFKPGLSKVKMPSTFENHAVNSCVYVSGSSHESEC